MTRIPAEVKTYVSADKTWQLGETPWSDGVKFPTAPTRVLIDNDFSGDPDDLYQLVHHLLSPSIEIRGIVASHLYPDDVFDNSTQQATNAEKIVHDVFSRMGLTSTELIYRGAERGLVDTQTPQESPAVRAIISEAMRDDIDTPLMYLAGGGLTDIASAILIEPEVAKRLTLVWIGGNEHEGISLPPFDAMPIEYNLRIDVAAGQVVFDDPYLEIWQVGREMYRQCLVSETELRLRVRNKGALGRYLYDETMVVLDQMIEHGRPFSETYALGDSPLVLLSALKSFFEPDTTSSFFREIPKPQLTADGTYRQIRGARTMRVYTYVDVRLMFEDMFLKIQEFCSWQES